MIDLANAPFPVTYRELWLPRAINGNATLPSSRHDGHGLVLSGAQKGSTVNGLEMRGAELITITDHADIHIADNLTVVLPAFILSGAFPADYAADMGLMNLNNGAVIARLNQATGALDFIFNNVDGGEDETVSTTKVSWAANTLWQVSFTFVNSGTGTISIRLYINGVAEATNDQVDGPIVVPAGNTVLGEDLTTFFTGKLQRMFLVYDTVVLTEAQLLEVYKGAPYATNLQAYIPLDHPGRGLAMPDRSTGGNCSGTISGTAIGTEIWDFGQVQQPVLSLDGINDRAQSSIGVNISGNLTWVWVGKIKSTYDGIASYRYFFRMRVNANNFVDLYNSPTHVFAWYANGSGASNAVYYDVAPSIDDYIILIGTLALGGVLQFFVNGSSVGTQTGIGVMSALPARAYIGSDHTPQYFDISKPLLVGLIDGVFTQEQARAYSRYLRNIFNLPISI